MTLDRNTTEGVDASENTERLIIASHAFDAISRLIAASTDTSLAKAHCVRDYVHDTLGQVSGDAINGPATPQDLSNRLVAHAKAERDYIALVDGDLDGPIWDLLCATPHWWSEDLIDTQNTDPRTLGLAYQAIFSWDLDGLSSDTTRGTDSQILARLLRAVAPLDLAAA
jgi:hypothetical protein